jgi:hypothetical protein
MGRHSAGGSAAGAGLHQAPALRLRAARNPQGREPPPNEGSSRLDHKASARTDRSLDADDGRLGVRTSRVRARGTYSRPARVTAAQSPAMKKTQFPSGSTPARQPR